MRLNVEQMETFAEVSDFSDVSQEKTQVYLRISKEITTTSQTAKSAIKSLKYFSSNSPRAMLQSHLLLLFVDSCLMCVFYFYWVIFRKTFEMIHNWSVTENSINLWAIHISSWLCCCVVLLGMMRMLNMANMSYIKVPGVSLRLHTLDVASLRTASR